MKCDVSRTQTQIVKRLPRGKRVEAGSDFAKAGWKDNAELRGGLQP